MGKVWLAMLILLPYDHEKAGNLGSVRIKWSKVLVGSALYCLHSVAAVTTTLDL